MIFDKIEDRKTLSFLPYLTISSPIRKQSIEYKLEFLYFDKLFFHVEITEAGLEY